MKHKQSKKENILVDAAKALGSAAGKVASVAQAIIPGDAEQPAIAKPATPKTPKKMKLAPKNKSREPRREKKARKKAQNKAAASNR